MLAPYENVFCRCSIFMCRCSPRTKTSHLVQMHARALLLLLLFNFFCPQTFQCGKLDRLSNAENLTDAETSATFIQQAMLRSHIPKRHPASCILVLCPSLYFKYFNPLDLRCQAITSTHVRHCGKWWTRGLPAGLHSTKPCHDLTCSRPPPWLNRKEPCIS